MPLPAAERESEAPHIEWRAWRTSRRIMHSRGEYLGSVEAPDRKRAEAVAIKQFDLDQAQRRRLLIRERD